MAGGWSSRAACRSFGGTTFAVLAAMSRLTIVLSLLAGSLCAQQPSIEVPDLLAPEANFSRSAAPNVVHRTYMKMRQPTLHIVSGEGHLLQPARPFFDERSLTTALSLLPTAYQESLEFVQLGERVQLRSPSPEQLQVAIASLRRGLPARITFSVKLERTAGGKTVTLLSGSETFANGETLAIGDVQLESLVTDIEVEIAQASASGNPVSLTVSHGASAQLRVRQLPGSNAVIVEMVSRVAAPFAAPPIPASKVMGSFDRVATRFDEAGLVFRMHRGEQSEHEWTANDGSRLRLSCQVNWPQSADVTPASVLCTPLLHAPVIGFRSIKAGEPDELQEMIPVATFAANQLSRGDDGARATAHMIGGKSANPVLVMSDKAGRQEVARLFQSVDAMLQSTTIVLEAFDVPLGAEFGAAGAAPAGAKKLMQLSGQGIVGLPSCFASGRERSVLHDWDVEIAQSARIADPKVQMFEDGWFATVKMLPPLANKARRVELALDIDQFVELRKLVVPISAAMVAATKDEKTMLQAEAVPVEQVVMRTLRIGKTVVLDESGGAVLRRAAPSLLGAERELVVRLRAMQP